MEAGFERVTGLDACELRALGRPGRVPTLAAMGLAIPLTCRIHEGVVFSNRDQRTLLDKMVLLMDALGMPESFYFVADAYYATGKIVRRLLANGNHLITRVKSNSVAWFPATPPPPNRPRTKGRPRGTFGHRLPRQRLRRGWRRRPV
jgi:hypothetical protein